MTPFEAASLSLRVLSRAGCFLGSIISPCPIVVLAQGPALLCSRGVTGTLVSGGACAKAGVANEQASPKSTSRFIALLRCRHNANWNHRFLASAASNSRAARPFHETPKKAISLREAMPSQFFLHRPKRRARAFDLGGRPVSGLFNTETWIVRVSALNIPINKWFSSYSSRCSSHGLHRVELYIISWGFAFCRACARG